MKRSTYIVYLVCALLLVFILGSTDEDRSDWDDGGSHSTGWHSGGHK